MCAFRRRTSASRSVFFVLCFFTLAGSSLYAAAVLHMDLAELCERADKIFRGTVVDTTSGTVEVGGGVLPTVTYRIVVSEEFKGEFSRHKEPTVVEVRMLGKLKQSQDMGGGIRRTVSLPESPRLQEGREYLLMTTAPSSIGLVATVGLGQGCFNVFSRDKQEMAMNEVKNVGLFNGPVAYSDLAAQIQALVGQ